MFSLSDALYLVIERARIISSVPAGRMLAVAADAERVAAAIGSAEVDIAALNGPAMTVVSGLAGEIDALAEALGRDGIACRPLRTAHAFHSSLLEPARDKLAGLLAAVPRNAPRLPIVSNRTGLPLTAEQAVSVEHWADHLVNPVRFAEGVQHCLAAGVEVFLELGAGQTLGGLVRQNLPGNCGAGVFGTLPARWQAGEESDALLSSLGQLWERGVELDWAAVAAGRPGAHAAELPLPAQAVLARRGARRGPGGPATFRSAGDRRAGRPVLLPDLEPVPERPAAARAAAARSAGDRFRCRDRPGQRGR